MFNRTVSVEFQSYIDPVAGADAFGNVFHTHLPRFVKNWAKTRDFRRRMPSYF